MYVLFCKAYLYLISFYNVYIVDIIAIVINRYIYRRIHGVMFFQQNGKI